MPMKPHSLSKFLVCLVLFAAVGAFDYFTGYEISSYPVYLMPIFLTFFYFGKEGGYVACAVATIMWTLIDIADRHHYNLAIARYWAAFSRLAIYTLFVHGLSVYVKTVTIHRRRLESLRQLISMCHGCGRIFWRDGTWKTFEEALELSSVEIPECPNCASGEKRK